MLHNSVETVETLQRELAVKQNTIDALLKGFLLTVFPVVDGLTFDVVYQPADDFERLGGDWYDVFVLPDGRTAFSIGDVCGKGVGAAVKMAQAKQAIKVAASLQINDPMPIAVLDQANKVIFLNDHHVQFTTAIYGIIDVSCRKITYACAGHHPPVIARLGEPARILPNHGFPLGVEVNLPDLIREHEVVYEPNSLLVFYTDGLIESNHDVEAGETRLLIAARDALIEAATRPARFIVDHVLEATTPRYPDDIAVLTILLR